MKRLLNWLRKFLRQLLNSSIEDDGENMTDESKLDLKNDLKNGLNEVADSIVDMFKEHGEELADVGKEYANKLKEAGIQAIAGQLTLDQFKDISDNYWLAARSELITRSYQVKAEAMDKLINGATKLLSVGIKALISVV